MRAWAWREAPTVNMAAETAKFRDYWVAQGGQRGRKLDWVATWRNWMRKAAEDRPSANGAKPPAVQYTSAFKVNPNR